MARELAGTRLRFLGSFVESAPDFGLPEVAFAGRSNVGKSACINAVVGVRGAARVSRRPGRTRSLNFFEVERRYVLVDLPGYGYARVAAEEQERWKGLVESYLGGRPDLRVVLVVVDPRRDPGGMDGVLVEGLRGATIPALVVATKCDKVSRTRKATLLANLRKSYGLAEEELLAVSSRTGEGIDRLRDRIRQWVTPPL